MRIAVYGGTGAVGSRVVTEAAGRGHEVTSLSRRAADRAGAAGNIVWAVGDAADTGSVREVAATHDAVVAAIGPSRAPDGDRAAYLDIVRELLVTVGGTRLIVVGGAGSLLLPDGSRLVDSPEFPEPYKAEALVAASALGIVRAAPEHVDWTYLSPAPELLDGQRTGSYRVALEEPAGGQISFEDYAVALVDELESPRHRRERFTVAN